MLSGGQDLEKLEFQGPPCWRFMDWAAILKSRTLVRFNIRTLCDPAMSLQVCTPEKSAYMSSGPCMKMLAAILLVTVSVHLCGWTGISGGSTLCNTLSKSEGMESVYTGQLE